MNNGAGQQLTATEVWAGAKAAADPARRAATASFMVAESCCQMIQARHVGIWPFTVPFLTSYESEVRKKQGNEGVAAARVELLLQLLAVCLE